MCRTMHRHLCQKYLNFNSNRKFPIYYCTAQIFIYNLAISTQSHQEKVNINLNVIWIKLNNRFLPAFNHLPLTHSGCLTCQMVISGLKWAFKLLFRLGLELLQLRVDQKFRKTFGSHQLCGVLPGRKKEKVFQKHLLLMKMRFLFYIF